MTRRNYVTIFLIAFVVASIVGNFTEKKVRAWVEVLYELVTGVPMVYDISQTDEKGVPYLIERNIGKQRNPMTICNRALSYYDKYTRGDSSQRTLFLNCADWLANDTIRKNNFASLKYDYDFLHNMTAPWRSGLANGVSLHVFIRAHALTHNQKYLDVAKYILNSFQVEVKEGGVSYLSEDEGWWFEEFADEGGLESRVLNGHMYALVGIHDYFSYTKDSVANYIFNQGVIALKNNLPKYERENNHSFYDLRGNVAIPRYHQVHIDLLDKLFEITGDEKFKYYRDKWQQYKHPSLVKRLVTHPFKPVDVAMWLVNFAITLVVVYALFYLFVRIRMTRRV